MNSLRKFSTILPVVDVPETITAEDAAKCHRNLTTDYQTHFTDDTVQREYENYRVRLVTRNSKIMWFFLGLLIVVDSLVNLISLHTEDNSPVVNVYYVVLIARILLGLVSVVLSITLLRPRKAPVNIGPEKPHACFQTRMIFVLTNVIIIGFQLVNGLLLCWHSYQGSCKSWNCRTTGEKSGDMTTASSFYFIVLYLLIISTLRCYSYWAICISCGITVAATVGAMFLSSQCPECLIMVLVAALSTCVATNCLECNTYALFNALLKFEISKRQQTKEMKYFVGNVAHDLKVRCEYSLIDVNKISFPCMHMFITDTSSWYINVY